MKSKVNLNPGLDPNKKEIIVTSEKIKMDWFIGDVSIPFMIFHDIYSDNDNLKH